MVKEALLKMLDAGEFERMLKSEKDMLEKRKIKQDKRLAEEIKEHGADRFPEIMAIMGVKSVVTFRDIACFASIGEIGGARNQ